MSDHPPTDPSPPPSRRADEDTDPHGGTVASGRVEVELDDFDALDERGQRRWLALRLIRLEVAIARVAGTQDTDVYEDKRRGLALSAVVGDVARLRADLDALPCRQCPMPEPCVGCPEASAAE